MKTVALIMAGGTSSRFGKSNKLLEKINGKEVIRYTVEAFEKSNIDEIVICANKSIIQNLKKIFSHRIVEGGASRQESVYKGLCVIDCDYVLIHDAARPVITPENINMIIDAVKEKKAVSCAVKTVDTIKEVIDGKIIHTLERSRLYNTQTPQAFEFQLIKSSHEKLEKYEFTDDASLLEYLGHDVYVVEGDYKNIKITTKDDIEFAKNYLK